MKLPTRINGSSTETPATALDRFLGTDLGWDPFAGLTSMRRAMNSLIDSAMHGDYQGNAALWAPALDLYEKDGKYVVDVSVPGLRKEDIDIEIADNRLTISATRQEEKQEDKTRYHYREVRRGGFSRTVSFPQDIEADKVTANYKDGILQVTVPLSKQLAAKKVAIQG